MAPRFTDLDELALLNIFNRLPLWKILQLASLCHQLNNIKREVFRTRTHLRLLGGCRSNFRYLGYLKELINTLDVDQNEIRFDFYLVLKFKNSPNYHIIHGEQEIELSHDIHVRNLEQITNFARVFPNLKKLVVAFTNDWERQSLEQLLRNWPKLTHLYFVDFQHEAKNSLGYDNMFMAINNLHDLQVLSVYYSGSRQLSTRNWPLEVLEPLLQNASKLHTVYFRDGYCFRQLCCHRVEQYRNHWDQRLNQTQLQIPFERIERFGLVDYLHRRFNIITNEQFISKTTRLEVTIATHQIRHLIDWSALQYLSLTIDLEDNSIGCLFGILTDFHNLHEFHIINQFGARTFRMPLESRARQLPQLTSVRRFEFSSITSPYD